MKLEAYGLYSAPYEYVKSRVILLFEWGQVFPLTVLLERNNLQLSPHLTSPIGPVTYNETNFTINWYKQELSSCGISSMS